MTRATDAAEPRPQGSKARLGTVLAGLGVIATCLAVRCYWGVEQANAGPPAILPARTASKTATPAPPATPAPKSAQPAGAAAPLKIVAAVNGEQITREQLANECVLHFGEDVLERVVNKYLIVEECKKRNITVSQAEVNLEIERMAGRFGLPTEQWLKMLSQERGITAAQYANDIIWPTLALRKLAGEQLQITDQEIQQEYETLYGPAVKSRLIVCADLEKAKSVRAAAAAKPEEFGNLAMAESIDASASLKGLIQPIPRHVGNKDIEQAAFSMKDGEVSQVIPVANQYVILKREELIPARNVPMNDQLRSSLEEVIRDRKMRDVASDVFAALKKNAQVQEVFNDPAKRQQMPQVAALINGKQISIQTLGEACIERHGKDVLEGTINRRLLEQACKKRNITITDADLDREIARAASISLPPKNGSPDVEGWLKLVTEQQGISVELYRRDAVWPSVALKKLVGGQIQVTEEDIRKGYEANYGPRVQCLAIVTDNLRRAQKVWEMARQRPTKENFGDLAAEYSIEASSRALRGEVPPIQKHGGQEALEKEAFSLQPGQLSGIVQVDSRYIILFCLGHTKPVEVDLATAKNLIREDVQEKKLQVAMAECFQDLQKNATVDNYLAGTSHSPKRAATAALPAAATPVRR